MHQELIDELSNFARRNDLRFSCHFDDELKIYHFGFQNQEQTWAYSREISQEQLDLFNGPTVYLAQDIINRLRAKIDRLF